MDSGISNKMYPASRVSFDLPRKIGKRKEFSRKIEGDSARRVNKMWLSLLLWIHHGVNQAASLMRLVVSLLDRFDLVSRLFFVFQSINFPFFQLCITLVQDGKKSRLFMCSKLVGPNVNYSPFVSICKYVLTVALQITFHVTQSNSVILK